jgi:hypothetical protein
VWRRWRRRIWSIVVVVVVWGLYYSSLKKLKITSLLRPGASDERWRWKKAVNS